MTKPDGTLFQEFIHAESSRGILLLLSSIVAFVWANSPWAPLYMEVWEIPLSITLGDVGMTKPLAFWINDGLMAMFFFVVGLEIKREVLTGELNSPRRAALPLAGALGGMVIPAALYLMLNVGSPGVRGWGIPMATDIAFSLGILSLLGPRVPLGLKTFLTALAIADDLGAILVIAVFYTSDISWPSLGTGFGFLSLLMGANLVGIRHPLVYAILGIGGVWVAFLLSGIHPTVAGVLAAWTIPARPRMSPRAFLNTSDDLLKTVSRAGSAEQLAILNPEGHQAVEGLERAVKKVASPLQRLESGLHPWVTTVIIPLFALANAGVTLELETSFLLNSVTLGVACGLLLGKPIGVTLAAWLAVRVHVASLPHGVTWNQIHAVGWLAGIGFTMSLFIGGLAFGSTSLLASAKVGIVVASIVASLIGGIALRRSLTGKRRNLEEA